MTTDRFEDDLDDAWGDPALAGLLTELQHLAAEPAPAIGPDLSAVLDGVTPIAPARARRSRAASAVVIGLVSTGVLAGGISAAAADELPTPVQRVVARVVNTITPFEIPGRDGRPPLERVPDESPSQPVPTELDEDTGPTVDPDLSAPPGTGGSEESDDNESEDRMGEQPGDTSEDRGDEVEGSRSDDGDGDDDASTGDRTRDESDDDATDEDRRDREDPEDRESVESGSDAPDAPDEESGDDGSDGTGTDSVDQED